MKNDAIETWTVGDEIWYDSDGLGLLFRGVIRVQPWRVGGDTWMVGIGGLPPEYREFVAGNVPPTTVASIKNVYKRNSGDDRSSIHWNQYLSDQKATSSKIGRVAATQEDTGS